MTFNREEIQLKVLYELRTISIRTSYVVPPLKLHISSSKETLYQSVPWWCSGRQAVLYTGSESDADSYLKSILEPPSRLRYPNLEGIESTTKSTKKCKWSKSRVQEKMKTFVVFNPPCVIIWCGHLPFLKFRDRVEWQRVIALKYLQYWVRNIKS